MLPRSITIGAFFFFVQCSALVALALLEDASSSYADTLTIAADAGNDILILIGAAPFALPLHWRLVFKFALVLCVLLLTGTL